MEVKTNILLKDNFVIKKGEKLRPKIIIYGLKEELKEEEVMNSLVSQNNLPPDAELKYEFRMKNVKGYNAVVSMNPEAFKHIIKKGKVNILWERFNIRVHQATTVFQLWNVWTHGKVL